MNKKLILSVFVILVVIAASLGATMAWFTDQATVTPNVFQAGTVLIDVDDDFAGANVGWGLSNWNPGDCTEKNITLKVIGSKKVYIKADFIETWEDLKAVNADGYVLYDLSGSATLADPSSSTHKGPGNSTSTANPIEWKVKKDDGTLVDFLAAGEWFFHSATESWYYMGYLEPGATSSSTVIISQVCLLGTEAKNQFQKAKYTLNMDFDAIQTTHEAVFEMWRVGYLDYTSADLTLTIKGWYTVVKEDGVWKMKDVPSGSNNYTFHWTPTGSGIANHIGWEKQ